MLSRKRAAELLTEAAELINGPRAQAYGEPQQSFENIAKHWSTYLGHEISVTDVGMMMILLKVSRHGRDPLRAQRDNLVDICGYGALIGGHLPTSEEKKLQVGVQSVEHTDYVPTLEEIAKANLKHVAMRAKMKPVTEEGENDVE